MVFMLSMEFLAPFSDDEEIDFPDQIAQLALDLMAAVDAKADLQTQRANTRFKR